MPTFNYGLRRYSRGLGFTLIELLIVIVIVGVLAALAVPSFRTFVAQQRIKTASFDMMAALTLARSEAIKRNANVDIIPSGGNWQNGWTIAVGGTTLSQQAALAGLAAACKVGAAIVTPCPTVTYNSNGRTESRAIEITSTVANITSRCITIDLSGRPNSKKGAC